MVGGMVTAQRRKAVARPRQPPVFNPPSIVATRRGPQAPGAFERMEEQGRAASARTRLCAQTDYGMPVLPMWFRAKSKVAILEGFQCSPEDRLAQVTSFGRGLRFAAFLLSQDIGSGRGSASTG
jgi:hypothetical protein